MTELELMRAEIAALRQRLTEAEATAKAALSGALAAHARLDKQATVKRKPVARSEIVEIVE